MERNGLETITKLRLMTTFLYQTFDLYINFINNITSILYGFYLIGDAYNWF